MPYKGESASPVLTPAGEQAWSEFLRHAEWPDGFALIFLFSSVPAVINCFRDRLTQVFRTAVSTVQIIAPASADRLAEEVLTAIRDPEERYESMHAPLWIEAYMGLESEWQNARGAMLARINEYRDIMRSRLHRPVIIVLPGGFRRRVQEIAPDLWSVRNHSNDLDEIKSLHTDTGADVIAGPDREEPPQRLRSAETLLAEWNRLGSDAVGTDVIVAGWRATDAALSLARPEQGYSIAKKVLDLARQKASKEASQTTLRDLSVSLDNVGDTARRMGNLGEAEAAYGESLKIRRDLVERYGATPESLRDLSVSLNKVGDTAGRMGNLGEAEAAYCENTAVLRRLTHAFPDTDEYRELLRETEEKLRDFKSSVSSGRPQ